MFNAERQVWALEGRPFGHTNSVWLLWLNCSNHLGFAVTRGRFLWMTVWQWDSHCRAISSGSSMNWTMMYIWWILSLAFTRMIFINLIYLDFQRTLLSENISPLSLWNRFTNNFSLFIESISAIALLTTGPVSRLWPIGRAVLVERPVSV